MSDIVVTLRKKNQLTVPEPFVEQLGLSPGDRLIISLDPESATLRARPLRKSYYGSMRGVYGTPEEVKAYLDEERAAWGSE